MRSDKKTNVGFTDYRSSVFNIGNEQHMVTHDELITNTKRHKNNRTEQADTVAQTFYFI